MKNIQIWIKRVASLVLALILVLTTLPTLALADYDEDGHNHNDDIIIGDSVSDEGDIDSSDGTESSSGADEVDDPLDTENSEDHENSEGSENSEAPEGSGGFTESQDNSSVETNGSDDNGQLPNHEEDENNDSGKDLDSNNEHSSDNTEDEEDVSDSEDNSSDTPEGEPSTQAPELESGSDENNTGEAEGSGVVNGEVHEESLGESEFLGIPNQSTTGGFSTMAKGCDVPDCTCTNCTGVKRYWYDSSSVYDGHWWYIACSVCGKDSGTSFGEPHSYSGNTCTKCGYTKSCSHTSTRREWTTSCQYKDVCTSCGATVSSGTSHGPYSYGSWTYYTTTQHRRSYTCSYGDSGTYYETASHSTTTKYETYSSTQHAVKQYCSTCSSYIGSTTYSNHSFTYGSWTNYSATQHRRTRTCSTCGYSDYEYKSHSLSYGSWTSTGDTQHQRTVTCSCGYSTTETGSHSITRTAWTSDGDSQHKRTASCSTCSYSKTETEDHTLVEGAWSSISDNQHSRKKTCDCGYSTTETVSHTLTYGKWTNESATQHKRTKSCDCGYSGTEYASHSMVPGQWNPVSETEHSRTNTCECGYTTTETGNHEDPNDDGNCDECLYLMTRFSVTVPSSLSLSLSENGNVTSATTAQIVNNSTDAVAVTVVKILTSNGWTLVPYTTNMANVKVNSKQIGFSINDVYSSNIGSSEDKVTSWQILKGKSLPLSYSAVVSPSSVVIDEQVLTVVFVVGWAE